MKKNDNTVIWLGLIALGVYFYFKNKKATVVTNQPTTAMDTSSVTNVTNTYSAADSYNVKYVLSGINKFNKVPNTI